MAAYGPSRNDRIKGAVGAILLQLAVGYALITGLAVSLPQTVDNSLKIFGVAPEPPPPPPEPVQPAPVESPKAEGAASPPNLTATPTQIVAPPPIVRVPVPPPPVIAAPKAGEGSDPSAGAADIVGPGTGSGGIGDGTGSGGSGDGGGSGGRLTAPRQTGGRITDADFPAGAAETGMGGRVEVRYHIDIRGRVTDCETIESSGHPELDDLTCRLLVQRFRFRPSRDERGRPVPSGIVQYHYWTNEPDPEREYRRRR